VRYEREVNSYIVADHNEHLANITRNSNPLWVCVFIFCKILTVINYGMVMVVHEVRFIKAGDFKRKFLSFVEELESLLEDLQIASNAQEFTKDVKTIISRFDIPYSKKEHQAMDIVKDTYGGFDAVSTVCCQACKSHFSNIEFSAPGCGKDQKDSKYF
jgi:hypothetical protein